MRRVLAVLALIAGCSSHVAASVDAAPLDGGGFTCSTSTCDPTTQYCYVIAAGVAPPVGCNDLPASCAAAPTCDCVIAAIDPSSCSAALTCTADGARVTVACMLP